MSIAAYKRTIRESESPRQIERRILARLTGQLENYAVAYDGAEDRAGRLQLLHDGLHKVLTDNQKMWTALKNDLASPGNALPAELRATLLSLALWVERQTSVVMGGGAGVGDLATVNRHIVAGLAGEAPGPRG
ncbi:flagellar biosynthesis regulator FlaF [Pseudooceanicola nanhaiensis]|uniref:flagellar biosynthesis regulator FlaF n=1 Tax=Pseudooceanicola nanhaiensis TaxID=375761 RepID=UPI001CD4C21B|nr:flagellar biosynthesis regulator FlaF [Pseudooceanicola nanhaiensis]MCA0922628.1 flaF protein [Pseudooceanicola nanhaiensis]